MKPSKIICLVFLGLFFVPLEPNVSVLSQRLDCSRELCNKMLTLLEKAKLLQLLSKKPRNYKQIGDVKKILGGDTNMLYALASRVEIGTIRETFFTNQLSAISDVTLADKGDFMVDNKYLFEVGGAGKRFTQIADIPDSYLAIDNTEIGFSHKIPLYLFGFLY